MTFSIRKGRNHHASDYRNGPGDAAQRAAPGWRPRPTTDKVKESVFNIVQFDVEGRRVLDLFGGTGQMGIEALSLGAASCTFVDVRKEAAAVIRANLAHTKLEEQGKVVQGDYLAFLTGCREKFDLVFLDPPYGAGMLERPWRPSPRLTL